MNWEKFGDMYRAHGENGTFTIIKRGTFYYPEYANIDFTKHFKMPRKKYLIDAKTMCEKNKLWER